MSAIHVSHRPTTGVIPMTEGRAGTLPPPAGVTVPVHHIPLRAVIFISLAAICGALDVAGVATSLIMLKSNGVTADTSLWRTCTNTTFGGVSQVGCANVDEVTDGCTRDSFRTMRAFGIMSIVVAFLVCVPLGIADLVGVFPRPIADVQNPAHTKDVAREVLAGSAAVLMCFQLVFWAIFAGLWTQGCGGRTAFRDISGSLYGPSAPLFIVAWILSLIMIAMPLALTRRPSKSLPSTVTTHSVLQVPGTIGAPFGVHEVPATAVATQGTHDIPVHALVYTHLALICGALTIAGLCTAVLYVQNDRATSDMTVWRNCTTTNPPGAVSGSCVDVVETTGGCVTDSLRAMRAFGILSVIFALVICLPLGVADIIGVLPLNGHRDLLGGAATLLMCFELVFWAIFAGLWNSGCGGRTPFKDYSGSKYGPASALFIAAWALSIAMIILPMLLGRPHEIEREESMRTGTAVMATAPGPHVVVNDPMTRA